METTTVKIDPKEEIGFMTVDETDFAAFSLSQQIRHLEMEGYVLMPDVLDAEHIAALKAELKDLPMTHKDYSKAQTVHHEPQCTSRLVAELIGHPPIAEFLKALMGPDIVFTHGLFTRTLLRLAGHFNAHRRPAIRLVDLWLRRLFAAPFAGALLPRRPAARARTLPAHPALPSLIPRPSQPLCALRLAPAGNHPLRQGRFGRHDTRPPLPRHPSQQGLGPSGTDPVRLSASLGRAGSADGRLGPRMGGERTGRGQTFSPKPQHHRQGVETGPQTPKACSTTHPVSIQTAGGTKV